VNWRCRCNQPHDRRRSRHTATDQAEDRPPDFRRYGFARDSVDQREARDGGGRGEDERHGKAQDRRVNRHEHDDHQTIGCSGSHQSDKSCADQAGAGSIGPFSRLDAEHEGQRINGERIGQDGKTGDQRDGHQHEYDHWITLLYSMALTGIGSVARR